jgi:hypothetical protein
MPLTITLRGRVLLAAMLSLCTIPSLCIAGDETPRPQDASQEQSTGEMQERGCLRCLCLKIPRIGS